METLLLGKDHFGHCPVFLRYRYHNYRTLSRMVNKMGAQPSWECDLCERKATNRYVFRVLIEHQHHETSRVYITGVVQNACPFLYANHFRCSEHSMDITHSPWTYQLVSDLHHCTGLDNSTRSN